MTHAPPRPPSRFTRAPKKVPPRIVLYGTGGIGKTTQLCNFPNAFLIRAEDGIGTIDVPATELIETYDALTDSIRELIDMDTPGTAVLDSADRIERLVWEETCARENPRVSDIEAFGYGKGYIKAEAIWSEVLAGLTVLNQRGWCIGVIAHPEVKVFNDPSSDSYDRYRIKLHARAAALLEEWADVVGFAHHESRVEKRSADKNERKARAVGTGFRVLALEETPAYKAKNRYGMPPLIAMDKDAHNLLTALHTGGAVLPTHTTTEN